FEQLIERAEPAGEDDEGIGPHCEMQFAHREIVKLKGEIRCWRGVGLLLHRKSYIESNGGRIGLGRPAIRGFHDAGSATGRDDIVANAAPRYERTPALGRDSTETPRFLIPPRRLIASTRHGTGRQCCGVLSSILATARQHTCAAKDDDRRADDPIAKPLFHLFVFQLQADAAHGIAQKKIAIEHGEAKCIGVFLCGIIVCGHSGVPAKTPTCVPAYSAGLSKMAHYQWLSETHIRLGPLPIRLPFARPAMAGRGSFRFGASGNNPHRCSVAFHDVPGTGLSSALFTNSTESIAAPS